MSHKLNVTIIDGINCFSPKVANDPTDFPENGYDVNDNKIWSQNFFWSSSRNRLFKRIVYNNLNPTGKTKYLEIGCATGDFIRHIIRNEDLEITGSEIYLKALVHVQKKYPNVHFIQYDVTEGVIGEQFDIITAFDVIEHIENDVAAISNIYAMLKRGGCLIISVPQYQFLYSRLDEVLKHKRRYAKQV